MIRKIIWQGKMNLLRLLKSVLAALGLLALLGTLAYYTLRQHGPQTNAGPSREIIVLRTPGGMLELSTIKATEVFDRKESCQFMILIPCGTFLTTTSVVAYYTYRVPLSKEWRTLRRNKAFIVIVPKVELKLPVALDTNTLQQQAGGTWSLITGTQQKKQMLDTISEQLGKKGSAEDRIELQRASARVTAAEFVQKWLISQTPYKDVLAADVRVVFEDESVRQLGVDWVME